MAAHTRIMKETETRMKIGYTATSQSRNAKWRPINQLEIYQVRSLPAMLSIAIAAKGKEGGALLYLASAGAVEVVKGLLMHLLDTPISLAADDELRSILEQVQKAIQLQDEEACQIVAAVKRTTDDMFQGR